MRRRGAVTRARNEEIKGTVGGAVLGGLLLGPFGAMLGSSIGSNLGAERRFNREVREAEEAELKRM